MGDALAGCRAACVLWQSLMWSCESKVCMFPLVVVVQHHAPFTNGVARVCLPPCAALARTRR
eukprot:6344389-Amphidinium_carterae.1